MDVDVDASAVLGVAGSKPARSSDMSDYCALGFPTIISHCFAGDGNAHESGRSFGAREHTDGGRRAIRVRAGVFQARANVPFLLFSLPFRVRPTRCAFCVTECPGRALEVYLQTKRESLTGRDWSLGNKCLLDKKPISAAFPTERRSPPLCRWFVT